MYSNLEPHEVPFGDQITQVVKEFAAVKGLIAKSWYHDLSLCILTEPERENVPVRGIQVTAFRQQGEVYVSFIPCFVRYDKQALNKTFPKLIPQELIRTLELDKFRKRSFLRCLRETWENCAKLAADQELDLTTVNLSPRAKEG